MPSRYIRTPDFFLNIIYNNSIKASKFRSGYLVYLSSSNPMDSKLVKKNKCLTKDFKIFTNFFSESENNGFPI